MFHLPLNHFTAFDNKPQESVPSQLIKYMNYFAGILLLLEFIYLLYLFFHFILYCYSLLSCENQRYFFS